MYGLRGWRLYGLYGLGLRPVLYACSLCGAKLHCSSSMRLLALYKLYVHYLLPQTATVDRDFKAVPVTKSVFVGICVEALCNPATSVQPLETVNLCLKALSTLLDDPWTRMRLGSDASLTVELLNVLHRCCGL